jgi:hypothetical protein
MKNKSLAAWLFSLCVALVALGNAQTASAQGCITDRMGGTFCPPAGAACLKDAFGTIKCSAPDGGIVLNRFQEPVCGPGQCVVNGLGEAFCSKVAKGYASLNVTGEPVCTAGCVGASASVCSTPTK